MYHWRIMKCWNTSNDFPQYANHVIYKDFHKAEEDRASMAKIQIGRHFWLVRESSVTA